MKARAYVNFALIKYWGKKIANIKVPHQSSLSVTIDQLYTETEVIFSDELKADKIIINGKKSGAEVLRTEKYLNVLREYYPIKKYCYLISENFVPTASGLASSASAFASIAKAFLAELNLSDKEISKAARLGSGSASRSVYGGFAIWDHGVSHETSYARPLNIDWPEFRIIIVLVSKKEKKHKSGDAMAKSVKNKAYQNWINEATNDLENMKSALEAKNIDLVGQIAENNSNKMHDLIELEGIKYRVKESYEIIEIIKKLRKSGVKAYYTMDAGPNVKIITLDKYVGKIVNEINVKTIVAKIGPKATII